MTVKKEEQEVESFRSPDMEKEASQKPVTNMIEVPDGGYGWVVVGSVFLFNVSTWAANSGFSIYLAHYLSEGRFAGAGKLDYSAIGGIGFGSGLILGPLILYMKEIIGIKQTIALGAIVQFIGIFLAAFSKKLWQLYLTQGLLVGLGLGLITVPSTIIIPQWFREKRSLAASFAAAGSGVGGIMFNLAVQHIIKTISLKWALIIQAIICACCTTTAIILLKTRDHIVKGNFKLWDIDAFLSFGFLLMSLFICFTLLGYVVLLYNLADFTISLGYSASQGSVVSCMVSVGIVFGRPTVGRLSDKFGPITTAMCAHSLVSLFCFAIWIPARNYSTAIGFALIQGSLMGSIWGLQAPITTRIFGLKKLNTVSGMLFTVIGLSGIASPVIGIQLRGSPPHGALHDPSQYRNPAIWCGCCYLASAMSLWLMRGYLIARDEEAKIQKSHQDNDELHIKVTYAEMFVKMLQKSKDRKV